MDRNSVTGLVLIGLILTVFSIMNQPSADDYKKKAKATTSKVETKTASNKKVKSTVSANAGPEVTPKDRQEAKKVVAGKIVSLENNDLHVDFNTKGGIVAAVYLKKYKSYKDFADKRDAELCLFKNGNAYNQLVIPVGNQKIHTRNYQFEIVK
jgi:YidC/Oxa1 family membrane protein insertase